MGRRPPPRLSGSAWRPATCSGTASRVSSMPVPTGFAGDDDRIADVGPAGTLPQQKSRAYIRLHDSCGWLAGPSRTRISGGRSTMGELKFGINLWSQASDWPSFLRAGMRAEELGFDTL